MRQLPDLTPLLTITDATITEYENQYVRDCTSNEIKVASWLMELGKIAAINPAMERVVDAVYQCWNNKTLGDLAIILSLIDMIQYQKENQTQGSVQ